MEPPVKRQKTRPLGNPKIPEITKGTEVACRGIDNVYHKAEVIDSRLASNGLEWEYYVHYTHFDNRLDEWVSQSRVDESRRSLVPDTRVTRSVSKAVGVDTEEQHHADLRVRNIEVLYFGDWEMRTWYHSPFPDEIVQGSTTLFMCEQCLKYMRKTATYRRHRLECKQRQPPGQRIYAKGGVSLYEVDGAKSKLWCQCLCLTAKLFLDHKTLYFDVQHFLFYVLTEDDEKGHHLAGYFSKEKFCAKDNNLACILVLPPYQQKGYGRCLVEFAYELSRRERKIGTPERPLSDLGKTVFESYWRYVICTELRRMKERQGEIDLHALSTATAIKLDDITAVLQALKFVKYHRNLPARMVLSSQALDKVLSYCRPPKKQLDMSALKWQPRAPSSAGW